MKYVGRTCTSRPLLPQRSSILSPPMSRHSRSLRFVAAFAAATLLLTGCGGGDEEGSADDPGPTTTRAGQAEDTAAAEAALLQLSDFPSGWSEAPADDEEEDDSADIGECVGSDTGKLIDVGGASASTGTFSDPGEDYGVENSVGVAATIDSAQAGVIALQDDDVLLCMQDLYRDFFQDEIDNPSDPTDTLPEGTSLGEITVSRLNVAAAGDDLAALRVIVPLSVESFEISLYADIVLIRKGRALSGLFFQSLFDPFPIDQLESLTALSADRLPAG